MAITKAELAEAVREQLGIPWEAVVEKNGLMYLRDPTAKIESHIFIGYSFQGTGYSVSGILTAYKVFPEVEVLLGKYYERHGIEFANRTITNKSTRIEEMFCSPELRIAYPEDVQKIGPYLRQMADEIMPFFEQYQTVEQVYDQVESMEVNQMSRFLYAPMPVRRMILKALLKQDDFLEYGERITNSVITNAHKHPHNQLVKFIKELFDELAAMQ